MTININRQTILKLGVIAAINFSLLVGSTYIATAGEKNFQSSTNENYSQDSKDTARTTGRDKWDYNWGDICNNYGPPGSINYHGNGVPKACSAGTVFNPFGSIYDLIR